MKLIPPKIILFLIFIFSLSLRLYNLNWDSGYHLHPDERMITMVAERIRLPSKGQCLFCPDSSLNPQFFAYGSFPIYLLKGLSSVLSVFFPDLDTYDKMNLLGRGISAFADSLTVLVIFNIVLLIFKSIKKALLASFFYSVFILPVQLAHFYAVDSLLTLFITLSLYRILLFYNKPSFSNVLHLSLSLALALATKISSVTLLAPIGLSFVFLFINLWGEKLNFIKKVLKRFSIGKDSSVSILKILFYGLSLVFFCLLFFLVFQPFSLTDFPTFWRQINEQKAMTSDPFVFPYTLQYVGTEIYLYPLKNIFLWGIGPILSSFCLLGFFQLFRSFFHQDSSIAKSSSYSGLLLILVFFLAYFIITGSFAVKFMRYMLPLYPLFSIFAAYAFPDGRLKHPFIYMFPVLIHLLWLFSFLAIYNQPNTRIQASDWINQNVAAGSMILREHWDDGLPLHNYSKYQLIDLPLYDPDTIPSKWTKINDYLQQADYLVIASHRLYTPLTSLVDCQKLPSYRCYPQTASYYQKLFGHQLGYEKVAQFTVRPNLFGIIIDDQSSDESFTVYDHPQVIIFKNTNKMLPSTYSVN